MGPGNSLGVSVAFPSFTFPSRFRYVSVNVSTTFPSRFRRVSVAFPFAFPLRFRSASACPTETTPRNLPNIVVLLSAGGRADPKPEVFWHSGSDLVSYPNVFQRFRGGI